jgi:hypothetical protein
MSTEGVDFRLAGGPVTTDTIAAAGTTDATIRPGGAPRVGLRIKNTGAADLTTLTFKRSFSGSEDDRDDYDALNTEVAALLPLEPDGVLTIEVDNNTALEWDFTAGSTAGTSFAYSWNAVR